MNFFEHQDQARKQTARLVGLMALAVVALIVITTLFVGIMLQATGGAATPSPDQAAFWQTFFEHLDARLIGGIAIIVISVVLLGSWYRLSQLRQGGAVVAESLNGRLLNIAECTGKERQLLNIVEEMAIAAGVPVPPVYLLDEPGINAFAAGYAPQDAVIGVTRGCLEALSRDQLQGVIAHEYSHIFNGDMRLNLRLVGVLHGILLIGIIGEMIMRSTPRRSSKKDGNSLALLGLGLFVIGYAGIFFGNLIKAAVSRQREFLADASAVQFTRNPSGISDALKRIGGHSAGSNLAAANAAEYSHFYFANGVSGWFSGLFATHPPLAERIQRIEPGWKGDFLTSAPTDETDPRTQGFAGAAEVNAPAPEPLVEQMGVPTPAAQAVAARLLDQLDPKVRDACHNSASAMAIIYGLLFTESVALEQESHLGVHVPTPVFKLYRHYLPRVKALPLALRLPVVELCLPALKALSDGQKNQFRASVIALIKADKQLTLSEWCLFSLLKHNLFDRPQSSNKTRDLAALKAPCRLLLAAVAKQGDVSNQQQAFESAMQALGLGLENLPEEAVDLAGLDAALSQLNLLKPLQKPRLIKSIMLALDADGALQLAEYELLRVIADRLNCPMPPLGERAVH
ncbi:M48 family metallopeptidase [Simiduia agarivorans]|uniref:Zn-dependent protease with chaperone function n=1 Tax=Simiduia agarivorans (strain DSM 21679 / JCM 13881 / BCRC 17597 / SA1) TaxID=1117647 RepID=K4KNU2_SIMAS|nr:M48 family metallopeptidase [Simiduia agarivorans]AFV00672.1 Zn-dependent protease with chaperone function [Simiduia agarivorans SA1 = DSM 21679]